MQIIPIMKDPTQERKTLETTGKSSPFVKGHIEKIASNNQAQYTQKTMMMYIPKATVSKVKKSSLISVLCGHLNTLYPSTSVRRVCAVIGLDIHNKVLETLKKYVSLEA
jgi:hypothetical protein